MTGRGSRIVVAFGLCAAIVAAGCKRGPQAAKVHRTVAMACPAERPPSPEPTEFTGPPPDCRKHADCTEGKNGRCLHHGKSGVHCSYDKCFKDDDCPGKTVCACRGEHDGLDNRCLKVGNCRVDGDCGPKGTCSPSLGQCGYSGGVQGYFCHSATDECINDADCEGKGPKGRNPVFENDGVCRYEQSVGHWKCDYSECT